MYTNTSYLVPAVENVKTTVIEERQPLAFQTVSNASNAPTISTQYTQSVVQPVPYQIPQYYPLPNQTPQYPPVPNQYYSVPKQEIATSTFVTVSSIPTSLNLRVMEVRGIHSGSIKEAKPYIEVKLKGAAHIFNSEKQEGGYNWHFDSTWNQVFLLHPSKIDDIVQIRIWDKRFLHDKYMGKAMIPVNKYMNRGLVDEWVPLKGTGNMGEVHLQIEYGTPIKSSMEHESIQGNNSMNRKYIQEKTVIEYSQLPPK